MASPTAASLAAATLLSASLAGTLVIGCADVCKQFDSEAALRFGLKLTRGDAGLWARLSTKLSGIPAQSALEEAERLDPHDVRVCIESGLRAEAVGDMGRAERYLNHATEIDRGYLPLWTLANFFVRHGDGRYALLLSRAMRIGAAGSQDLAPAFDLGWQASGSAAFILRDIVGVDAAVLRAYVPYLIGTGRTEALAGAALSLATGHVAADRAILLETCDWLLVHGRASEALLVWNTAIGGNDGNVITNGAMAPPIPLGFDWKFNSNAEHALDFQGGDAGVRIALSGGQPELFDALRQTLPMEGRKTYLLRWEAKAEPAARGVEWVLTPLEGEAVIARIEMRTGAGWTRGETRIVAPTDSHFSSLILRLQKRLGEPRLTGSVWIRKVELRRAD